MKEAIETTGAPKPSGPYSQAIQSGDFIFVSGQDGASGGATIAAQTAACLENINNILAAKGAGLEDIVHVTCHISELNEATAAEFNRVYAEYFKEVVTKPARITTGSQLLGAKVEITAIAAVS
ncbi:RidA family protein [Virgibacillus siamensis]|uniref:RidA family protein n=1 Tax=Virgibacillus siamensis TaxID=480071 RepID=UPI000987650F|nr:Rid family hydrolase [Virgibacillus siamensis]